MQSVAAMTGNVSLPGRSEEWRAVSLCELLDRVLNKGVVLSGEIVISVADIELIYIGLNAVVCSVQTLLAQSAKTTESKTDNSMASGA